MKKIFSFMLSCVIMAGCGLQPGSDALAYPDDSRLQVVATIFPQYDFARRIAGDSATVRLLIPPGVETHSFDPSPSDIIMVGKSDLFLYTGAEMEPWAANLLAGLETPVDAIDLSAGLVLGSPESDPLNLIVNQEGHADHDHAISSARPSQTNHDHFYDPHIWTSPKMAMQMVSQISAAFCDADPQNAESYRHNEADLISELQELDAQFREVALQAQHREIVFGSRFAVYYFAREYGFSFLSAYDSCSSETEPAARTLAQVIDYVREHKINTIYYQELSETKVAQTIAEATGAKLLLFHSCHTLSMEEFSAGETYLSLMRQNLEHLREGVLL